MSMNSLLVDALGGLTKLYKYKLVVHDKEYAPTPMLQVA